MADTGPDQGVCQDSPQRPTAAQRHMTGQQPALAFFADAVKAHLPAVAVEVDVHHSLSSSCSTP